MFQLDHSVSTLKLMPPISPRGVPKTPQPLNMSNSNAAFFKKSIPQTPSSERDPESDIKVFLRVRPILPGETQADLQINENTVIAKVQQKDKTSKHHAERTYSFTHIFKQESEQEELFQEIAMPLLKKFIRGYDALLFAYGATSAGKTFTVRGTEQNPGLIPKMVRTLLAIEQPVDAERGLFVSCVEVYNERIHDLLGDTKQPMRISKDGFGFTVIKDAKEIEIKRLEDLKSILSTVDKAKSVCATTYNSQSSRSHCVFMLKLISIPIDPKTKQRVNDISKVSASRLSIVDLAGSERVDPQDKNQKVVNEAISINSSMFTLGQCIRMIRQTKLGVKGLKIPYRQSKITELFKDFFDPVTSRKTYCSIIINISPSTKQISDTLFALQFAAEAVECRVAADDVEEEDEEDLVVGKALNFSDESENVDDNNNDAEEEQNEIELLKLKEAKIRQEIHSEFQDRYKKITKEFENNITQLKASSAQVYPCKLQAMLAQKAQADAYKRSLLEAKTELERLQSKSKELDKKVEDVEVELKAMIEKCKIEGQKNRQVTEELANMESTNTKLEGALEQIHQKLLETQTQCRKEYEEEMDEFQRRIKEIN